MTLSYRATLLAATLLVTPAIEAQPLANVARRLPAVESAMVWPTVESSSSVQAPEVSLRAADPERGGVLRAGAAGSATLFGPAEDQRFMARVSVEFLDAETSVRFEVIDSDGSKLNELVVSSVEPGRWTGNLCDVIPSQGARVEMLVTRGRALGTAYRVGQDHVTSIPILSRGVQKAAAGGTMALSSLIQRGPESGLSPLSVGTSDYTGGTYSWPGTNFSYVVNGGPPNTCGDIYTLRNGAWQTAGAWLCTDSSGYGQKGPWYVTYSYPGADQTDAPSYIRWPNQTETTWAFHVIDVTPPTVTFAPNGCFSGTVSDGQWGAGFSRAWAQVRVELTYRNDRTGLYWNKTDPCYGFPDCYTSSWPTPDIAWMDLPQTGTASSFNWWYSPYVACPKNDRCSTVVKAYDLWSSTQTSCTWQASY